VETSSLTRANWVAEFCWNVDYPVVDERGHALRVALVEADPSRETHGKSHTTLMYFERELSRPLRLKSRECSAAMVDFEPAEQARIPRLITNRE
jgi:hypothetical protein